MADEADRLVTSPFREIVEKGNLAIENAHTHTQNAGEDENGGDTTAAMLRSAQSLVKEGERALKRIEPLSTRSYEEYGANFIDAVKEHDELAQYRSQLEDLLWDFDDFIEVPAFDASKFEELQKTSRRAAPKIVDILKRLKLSAPRPPFHFTDASISGDSSEPRAPTRQNSHTGGLAVDPPESPFSPYNKGSEATPVSEMMSAVSGPDEGLSGSSYVTGGDATAPSDLGRSNSYRSEISGSSEPPPRPPSTGLWAASNHPPRSVASDQARSLDRTAQQRRPPQPLLAINPKGSNSTLVSQGTSQGQGAGPESQPNNDDDDDTIQWAQRQQQQEDQDGESRGLSASRMGSRSDDDGSMSPVTRTYRWTNSTIGSLDSTIGTLDSTGRPVHNHVPRSSQAAVGLSQSSPTHTNESITTSWLGQTFGGSPHSQSPAEIMTPPWLASAMAPIPKERINTSHCRDNSLSSIQNIANKQLSQTAAAGSHHPTRQPSTESVNSSIFDLVDNVSNTSPVSYTNNNRHSNLSAVPSSAYSPVVLQPPAYPGHPLPHRLPGQGDNNSNHNNSSPTIRSPPFSTLPEEEGGDDYSIAGETDMFRPSSNTTSIYEGLIPVHTEEALMREPQHVMPMRQPDCTIGPNSSFYKLRGFCKGAEEARRGYLGFKKIKRPVGGFSMVVVAKCTHCLFELDYKTVEQDLRNDSSGNYTANSMGFRIRALQKSHLAARHVEEQLYGCPFCIEQGKTSEESDATVFFSQKQLFAHLARHPRPLPKVPGLDVIEGPVASPHVKDNFDMHFKYPPVISVMMGIMPEVAKLPTAVAIETRKSQHGVIRQPPDRIDVLQFAMGAKIVGIEWPARYEGKWGIGWHDGVRAAFEAETVLLEPPPKEDIKLQGASNLQALARWKWHQKGGDEKWLRFDKGDIIKNISYHWCWSGVSSRGWGIFPQSHIEPNSIKTNPSHDGGSVSSGENKKSPLWLSLRRNADLSVESIFRSGTTSSGGGISPHPQQPSRHPYGGLHKVPSVPSYKPPFDEQWIDGGEVGRNRVTRAGL